MSLPYFLAWKRKRFCFLTQKSPICPKGNCCKKQSEKVPCSVSKGLPYLLSHKATKLLCTQRADVRCEIKRTVSSQVNMWHWMQVEEHEISVMTPLK